MPEPREHQPPIPLSQDEAKQTIAIALNRLCVQIGAGKRLPGGCDGERQRIAERLVRYFDEGGMALCKTRWMRPHSIGTRPPMR